MNNFKVLRQDTIKDTKIEMIQTNDGLYEHLIIRMYYKKDGKTNRVL